MLFLITGTVGAGKTAFAISKILEYRKTEPTRQIYTNIEAVNIPDVISIEHNDYEQYADGSIFFFDEAQQFLNFKASHEAKDDKITQSLQVSRHRGFDIYFITQHPSFLSKWVTCLINEHFHLVNAMGLKASTLYRFTGVKGSLVNLDVLKDTALDVKRISFDNTIFSKYKSASIHTKKFSMPKKLKFYIFLFVLIFSGFFYLVYYNYKNSTLQKATVQKKSTGVPQFLDKNIVPFKNSTVPLENTNNASAVAVPFIYNYEKPYLNNYTEQKYQPVELPKFSGAMLMGNKCVAYTQQGTVAKLSKSDCLKVANGDIPFNPFKQNNQQANNYSKNELSSGNKLSLE